MKHWRFIMLIVLPLSVWPSLVGSAGTIVGSYHDLSHLVNDIPIHTIWAETYYAENLYNDYNQVCVYCHTPHNADQATGPLWNRTDYQAVYTLYSSGSLNAVPGQPSKSTMMCLSCHDGTIALDEVINLPNTNVEVSSIHYSLTTESGSGGMMGGGDSHSECYFCHDGKNTNWPNLGSGFLGSNLSDDHPVSIPYIEFSGMKPIPVDGDFGSGVRLVEGKVECATCHEPHDPDIKPFLRITNNGSTLCLLCHNK